jgi:hypothetical protein
LVGLTSLKYFKYHGEEVPDWNTAGLCSLLQSLTYFEVECATMAVEQLQGILRMLKTADAFPYLDAIPHIEVVRYVFSGKEQAELEALREAALSALKSRGLLYKGHKFSHQDDTYIGLFDDKQG